MYDHVKCHVYVLADAAFLLNNLAKGEYVSVLECYPGKEHQLNV